MPAPNVAGTCLRVIDYGLTRASLPVASLTSAEDLSRGDDSMHEEFVMTVLRGPLH